MGSAMPRAGRILPNTMSVGSLTTPSARPVRTMTLSATFVKNPKNAFQSPGTHSRTRYSPADADCMWFLPCLVSVSGAGSAGHDVRAGPPGDGVLQVRRRRDDGALPAALDELDRGPDLRSHAARRELAGVEIPPRFRHREAVEEALVGLAEADRHLLNARRDDEDGHAQIGRQQPRGEVLVYYGFDAAVDARLVLDHRNAAAAAGDDDESRLEQGPDGALLDDAHGPRRGDEAPEAAPRVLDHHPMVARRVQLGLDRGVAAADGLARLLEGWVLRVHDGLGEHAGHLVRQPPAPELAHERVADDVADAAFRIGHAHVQRQPRSELLVRRDLRAQEDEADLWPIAVGEHDAPAVCHERAHVPHGGARVLELLRDGALLPVENQRVPANRNDHPSRLNVTPFGWRSGLFALRAHRGVVATQSLGHAARPRRRPSSARAALKQARGARAMPAPIWPMPASLWAMPVLMTGATPLSTTRRASMAVGVPAKPRDGMP